MITIPVNTSKPYEIKIGNNTISTAGAEIKALGLEGKIMIVSDDNVAALYLPTVRSSFEASGFEVYDFVISHGETSKNADNLLAVLSFAADCNFSRRDTFVALGGGVVGDLCGFAASTYMRGVNFVQIPTSLLAAVDSSVGGKTAIDLPAGKNLVGTFYQPGLVICDTNCFNTLPDGEFSNGMAEVIKYGMFCDSDLLDILDEDIDIEKIVARCVEIKARIVSSDEFEKGERAFLNFGHTVAHAIEKISSYRIPHGSAVAVGMVTITKACTKKGMCESAVYDTLVALLKKYNLPCQCDYGAEEIYEATLKDKKNADGKITLILPTAKGKSILKKCEHTELKELIILGLK